MSNACDDKYFIPTILIIPIKQSLILSNFFFLLEH